MAEFINLDSSEEDIVNFCNLESNQSPGYGHEMRLNYGLNLLSLKQQKSLVQEQNHYNNKQLFWSRVLAVATIALVIATILLVKFN
jgi:hypothetical protein